MSVANDFLKVVDTIEKEDPGCIAWWRQQLFDFFQEAIDEFEEFISKHAKDPHACEAVMRSTISELERLSRFHHRAIEWVMATDRIHGGKTISGQEISWRIRPPKGTSVEPMEPIGPISKRCMQTLIAKADKIKEEK